MDKSSRKPFLLIYYMFFLCVGLLGGSVGPVIPFLASERNIPETSFSFLFTARTIGSIAGFVILKFLQNMQKKYIEHKIMAGGAILNAIFAVVFIKCKTDIWAGISMAVFDGAHYAILTACNVCILAICQQEASRYLTLVNAVFGVGALVSPLIVRYIQTESYYLFAVAYALAAVLSLCSSSPIQSITTSASNDSKAQKSTHQPTIKIAVLVGLGVFLIVGIESTFSGWIPTYAVNTGLFSLEDAAICGTLFWTMSTLFRFVSAAVPLSNSQKLGGLLISIFFCSITCLLLHHLKFYYFLAIGGSLLFGLSCSAVCPLLIGICAEYNLTFSGSQMSSMMIAPAFSNMLMVGVTGSMMEWDISMLFYSLVVASALLGIDSWQLFKAMKEEGKMGIEASEEEELNLSVD